MTQPERLYGLPHSEVLHTDIATVWESDIEPYGDPRPTWTIEEWTVRSAIDEVPSAYTIVDRIDETICDDGEFSEDPFQDHRLTEHADVIEAAETLRQLVAAKITWFTADKKIAEHTITFDADGEPQLNGEPMYRPVATQ